MCQVLLSAATINLNSCILFSIVTTIKYRYQVPSPSVTVKYHHECAVGLARGPAGVVQRFAGPRQVQEILQ